MLRIGLNTRQKKETLQSIRLCWIQNVAYCIIYRPIPFSVDRVKIYMMNEDIDQTKRPSIGNNYTILNVHAGEPSGNHLLK